MAVKTNTRITIMTATEALRAYNRFVDDWPAESWLVPTFIEWATHKNIKITGLEVVKPVTPFGGNCTVEKKA